MEFMLAFAFILAIVAGAAIQWGVDSRPGMADDHLR
jgi:hypothetical protein